MKKLLCILILLHSALSLAQTNTYNILDRNTASITGGTISGTTITTSTYNGNTLTTGSSTYTGTAGQTYTMPTTSATLARTDAAQTFTGGQKIAKTITSTYTNSDFYLKLGNLENLAGSTRLIGFGYQGGADVYSPAYIGYLENSNSGETNGNLVFGTRSATTDTQPTERMRIDTNGLVTMLNGLGVTGTITASAIASSGAAQSGYLCYNTTGGVITYDGGATCLVSLEEYKDKSGDITGSDALRDVLALRPFWGKYKDGTPMSDHRQQPFFGAHQVESVDARLAAYTEAGELHGVRYANITAVLAAAIQEQQRQINRLKRELKSHHHHRQAGSHPGTGAQRLVPSQLVQN